MSLALCDTDPADAKNAASSDTTTTIVKISLIRHGESQANAGLPTQSSESVELTVKGFAQAWNASNYLKEASFIPDLIITSSYRRTQESALPLRYNLSERDLFKPIQEWPIHEFTYLSTWHNVTSTFAERQTSVKAYWQNADPTYVDGPGSESFEQFINRVRDFKDELESTEYSTIAVFSHEQFISAFLWLLQQGKVTLTSKEMRNYRKYLLNKSLPNGAIVQAEFHRGNGKWTFKRITEHLSELKSSPQPVSMSNQKPLSIGTPVKQPEPVEDFALVAGYRRI